jgi:hypothetical protein
MLTMARDRLEFLVAKARAYDAEVAPEGMEEGSNAADDREVGILEDTPDNPTRDELQALLDDLNDDEIVELLALTWVGRGDYSAAEWPAACAAARAAHDKRAVPYLMETPNLGDLVEEGIAALDAN